MVLFAYHASHEQFSPSALLRYARLAEQAGFTAVSSSEYLQPWSPRQGQSGFAWARMGAAMQATSLPFSVVCAPGPRYHPMSLAQAAATLAELCPGRFHMALGSGEALNERVTGELWPSKPERTVGGAPEDVRQKVDAFYEGEGLASRRSFRWRSLTPVTRPRRVRGHMSSGGPTSSLVKS